MDRQEFQPTAELKASISKSAESGFGLMGNRNAQQPDERWAGFSKGMAGC